MRRVPASVLLLPLAVACGAPATVGATLGASTGTSATPQATSTTVTAPDWTSYHHDGSRDGVADGTAPMHPLHGSWTSPTLDGQVYGQPVGYGGRVYVATENDSVYALDATRGSVLWARHLATPVPAGALPCGNISPTVGITSTMVLDPARNELFAVADTDANGVISHRLWGLNATNGGVVISSRPVDPAGSIPRDQLQRTGLALDGGYVVIGFGGNWGDCGSYHGYVVSTPEASTGLYSYQVSAGANGGAVWAGGAAPAVDGAGHVFVATGNAQSSSCSQGNSVLELSATMGLVSQWADPNCVADNNADADLGSAGPLLLPGGLIFVDGKQSTGYLLASSPLVERAHLGLCASFGGDAYAYGKIFVTCTDGVHALNLNTSTPAISPAWGPAGGNGPPVVAGGLVWSVDTGSDVLSGLDPSTGGVVVSFGITGVAHFTSPTVIGGRIIVATNTNVHAWTGPEQPVMATVGTNHAVYLKRPGTSFILLGGYVVNAPAVYGWNHGTYLVGIGTTHQVYLRSATSGGWVAFGPTGTYCKSVAAAVQGSTLTVACTNSGNGLSYATAALVAGQLPKLGSWVNLGGSAGIGVAVAPVRGVMTFVAVATSHAAASRSVSTAWRTLSYQCYGQPALAAGDYSSWFACPTSNGHVIYSVNLGYGYDAGSVSAGAPGVAALPDGTAALFALSPTTRHIYERVVGTPTSNPWVDLSGTCIYGAGAAETG